MYIVVARTTRGAQASSVKSRDTDPRAVLAARHQLCAGNSREPARGGTGRIHNRPDARVPARAEGRIAPGQEDWERATFRAGDRSDTVPQRVGSRASGPLRRFTAPARLQSPRNRQPHAEGPEGPSSRTAQ